MWRLAAEHILWLLAAYGILAFVIYLILVTFEPLDGLRLSTQLALGQVIIGWVALSIAIPGGYFAVREFMRATARADMHLRFGGTAEKQKFSVARPLRDPVPISLSIEVENHGDAITPWWQLTLFCPQKLGAQLVISPTDTVKGEWAPQPDSVWVFTSRNQEVVFRGLPLAIGKYGCQIGRDAPLGDFLINYTILTDRGRPTTGNLTVTVTNDGHDT